MHSTRPNSHAAIVAATLLTACHATPDPVALPVAFSFDEVATGALPPGWTAAETNGRGKPGRWGAAAEPDGGRSLRLLATDNAEDTFNLVLLPGTYPADLALEVRVRADAGREDQGGGLVWRARGPGDYYVVRWNPLEDNVRAYHVVGGRRSMIRSADTHVDPDGWHSLRMTTHGASVRVWLDGREVLAYDDGTLSGPGQVGVWTKADAATSFDDLRIARPDA